MILTETKIKVTHSMMVQANMTRGGQYGIPKDPKDPSLGLVWKDIIQM